MLRSRGVKNVRIWARGIDLELFGPHRRSRSRREAWGVALSDTEAQDRLSGSRSTVDQLLPAHIIPPFTPPPSPDLLPVREETIAAHERPVVLYVGRV